MSVREQKDPLWDERLDGILRDFLNLENCHLLLDAGCGTAHWTETVIRQLPSSSIVVGIDYDKARLTEAKERLGYRVEFVVSDAEAIPFRDNTFDLVTCRRLLMNVKHKRKVVGEMIRINKVRGVCSCVEPDFTKISEHSTVKGESRIYKRIEKDSDADLGFGPKAASIFLASGLQNIDVWSYCITSKTLPPYPKSELGRLHGYDRLEDAVKGLVSNLGSKEKRSLISSASKIDREKKRQKNNNHYSNVQTFPLIITKGTKMNEDVSC